MLQEGQKFGDKDRYELVRLLGRGGFSEVWLANDDWTHIQVAIKVYAPGTGLDEAGIAIFTQEFSMVFDMNHTNLLKPTYFDSWERQPYLIMPLCQNGSAFKYVAGKERITEEQCWNMLHDVAAGLAYLHAKNPPLIHQDIKPDNILISDEGAYMITDFGISARVRSTIRSNKKEEEEQSGGTLAYMGPERFSSRPRPIMASDIWSLGAMMYEIICGQPPFGNNGGLMQKKGAEIPEIDEPGFSQELKDIIYSCLNEDPAKRPWASAIEEITYKHIHGIDSPTPSPQPYQGPQPMQSSLNPYQQTQNPMQSSLNPYQQTQQPMQSSLNPYQQTQNPYQGTQQPMQQSLNPYQQTQNPYQQTQQPFQGTQQPFQPNSVQGSQNPYQSTGMPAAPATGGGMNKKLIGIIAGVAAVLLIGAFFLFSGGSDNDEAEAAAQAAAAAVPEVSLDSIALVRIATAQDLALEAKDFQEKYGENQLDSANGMVEKYYLDIIDQCKMFADEAAMTPDAQLNDAALKTKLDEVKADAEKNLLDIYKQLKTRGDGMASIGSSDMAEYFLGRAAFVKPYVEHLLTE